MRCCAVTLGVGLAVALKVKAAEAACDMARIIGLGYTQTQSQHASAPPRFVPDDPDFVPWYLFIYTQRTNALCKTKGGNLHDDTSAYTEHSSP